MSFTRSAAGVAAFAYATVATFMPPAADAAAQDYRFEAAGPPVKSGKATVVKIRLVHVPDGKPVPGAVIFQTRFDMGPDGMASMTAPAKLVRSSDTNLYQVELEPQMGGNWALSLSAKVQGETETVTGSVPVTIPK
ncbi:MAG: FixH family protein [Stellaceae bacterium]